jgi:hypothetical protein
MVRASIGNERTLALARNYVRCARRFEECIHAHLLTNPWRKLWGWKKRRLREKSSKISHELTNRYEGILRELLYSHNSHISEDEVKEFITAVWLSASPRLSGLEDYRFFSTIVWQVYEALAEARQLSINPLLKPKFMLRQFVEEIPRRHRRERAVLRQLVFDAITVPTSDDGAADDEVIILRGRAYPLFHLQLLRLAEHLQALTDGVISKEEVANIESPFVQFDDWFFPAQT